MSPINGSVDIPDHTREGGILDYRCNDGFRPSVNFTSVCLSTALWTPPPHKHSCTFVTGEIKTLYFNQWG